MPLRDLSPLLRPSLFVVVAAAHAAAFGYGSWRAQPMVEAPRLSIEVTLASPPPAMEAAPADEAMLQEAPAETPPPVETTQADIKPAPPVEKPPEPAPEPQPEPTPEPAPEPIPDPTPEVAPEPEAPAIVTATPPPRPDDVAPFVAPPANPVTKPIARARRQEARKPIARPKPEPRVAKPAVKPARQPAPSRGRAAPQTAGSSSRAQASAAATVNYGGLISAAIRARTAYPSSARGGSGVVKVTFVIGPSGRTQSASVIGSSGDPALDRAALAAVQGVSAPPPPGGRYAATQAIRFNVR